MSDFALPECDLSPALARLVDQRCDQFEAEWKAGRTPHLEDHLGGVTGPDRSLLLGELLAVELAYRSRTGQLPDPAEYRKRFPDEDERIRIAWAEAAPNHALDSQSSACDLLAPPAIPEAINRSGKLRIAVWLAVVFLVLLAVAVMAWPGKSKNEMSKPASTTNQTATALSGNLMLTVSNPAGTRSRLRLEEPGALPVRNGDLIHLEVKLNQPAYLFLLLLDGQGNIQPLYPWDPAKGFDHPTPSVQPGQVLHIPPERDRGWVTDGPNGLDTVLLLARRTPLPPELNLARLVNRLPPTSLRDPREAVWLSVDESIHFDRGQHRGSEMEAQRMDEPLLGLLETLRLHFEVIRAVRYAHQGN